MVTLLLAGGPKDGCTLDIEDPGLEIEVWMTSGRVAHLADDSTTGRGRAIYRRVPSPTGPLVDADGRILYGFTGTR